MLTLTSAATKKLQDLITQQNGAQPGAIAGLRLSVHTGGCSGYSYGMEFTPGSGEGDWVGEFDGVKVMVDPQSVALLEGVQIDYVETLQATGFTISNPKAVRSCGCGKSFETA